MTLIPYLVDGVLTASGWAFLELSRSASEK
jgi:hypothetical protein